MTMYFPLVVHGAMLIEPTESESKAELDRFIDVMKGLAKRAKAGEADFFQSRPDLRAAPPTRRNTRSTETRSYVGGKNRLRKVFRTHQALVFRLAYT